ncbi:MAG TPA: hypothetical protein VFE46_13865 [Pirellulales bacterium]|nr:hypothetical protein [Pirellulales bacterium]
MRLYLESNFVLELALQQQESNQAEQLLALAEKGTIELAIPVFALCEPFSTISQRSRNRQRLISQLSVELQDLQRSWLHVPLTKKVEMVASQLAAIEQSERNQLEKTISRLINVGRSIPLTELEFAEALLQESRHGLSPQDAIILG